MGSLIGASVLPRLIVIAIEVLAMIIFLLLIQLTVQAGISAVYSHSSSFLHGMGVPSVSSLLGTIANTSYFVLFEVLLCYVAMSMLGVFQKLFTYRAVGHWIARFAPQWAQASHEKLEEDDGDAVSLDGRSAQPENSPFTPAP